MGLFTCAFWIDAAQGADAPAQTVTVTISPAPDAPALSPLFLGLSYEMRILLPGPVDRTPVEGSPPLRPSTSPAIAKNPTGAADGKYYFDASDESLVRIYQTLGIRSLRVGANAVDDPRVAIPDTEEIDALFNFAKKAGAKVIYSFRLKKGDPANAARLAKYITDNYATTLDCFAIGNEPDFYHKTYEPFRDEWRPIYEAILKAVPDAKFSGPSTSRKAYSLEFADEFFPEGHLQMVSTHTYALGNGRVAENDPPASRARFVSNATLAGYQRLYDGIVKPLEGKNIPYRLGETNSCFGGGARDCSDSYASTLWVLDYLNWWAAHHIKGMNFHTGDTVNGFPIMNANYAIFVHKPAPNEKAFVVRPVAYGLLAFSQTADGKTMNVKIDKADNLDFTAYAYSSAGDQPKSIILLNKTHGDSAAPIGVTLVGVDPHGWQMMSLEQETSDLASKTDVTLGGAPIAPDGSWSAHWTDVTAGQEFTVSVKPTTAMLLRKKAPEPPGNQR